MGTPVCNLTGYQSAGTSCGLNEVCNSSHVCVMCSAGTSCDTGNACELGQISCSTGAPVCTTTGPAPDTTTCDDGDPCTSPDHCDGAGNCTGAPIAPTYVYEGNNPTGQFPVGNSNGVCIYSAFYCSTTGVQNIPPPTSPTGYSSAPSNPAGCDYNGGSGNTYQRNFCKSCNGNCTANCP
jgi:hypothetical protein